MDCYDDSMSKWQMVDATCPKCGCEFRTHMYPPDDPEYSASFGDDKLCDCGHPYYRHFDTYDDMYPVGCKYCQCEVFKEPV